MTNSRAPASELEPTVEVIDLTIISQWSDNAQRLLGWTAGEACGQDLGQLLIAEGERQSYAEWAGRERSQACAGSLQEFTTRHRDGRQLPMLYKLLALRPEGTGTVYRLSLRALCEQLPAWAGPAPAAGCDANPCELMGEELRRQQFLLQYIINFVPHAIFWKDREDRFLGGNQYFLSNALGLSSEKEIVGKNDYDFFPKEQADYFRRCDFAVMDSGEPMLDNEEPQRSDKGERVLVTSKVPLRDETGAIVGLLGIYADITQRKRMELELKEAKLAAEAAAAAKSEFLTTVSHELRTPLSLILGPLETLLASQDEPLSERARSYLLRIQRNTHRLHRLVNDILDYQKLEAGKMTLDWEPVEINELCADLVDDAQLAAERGGLALGFIAEPALGAVPLDRRKFEKILLNLLGNALKFTPRGGEVSVCLRAAGDYFELLVTDTGPGIAPDKRHLLFRRFQQIDSSATRRHEGTGIGLSLVKELTEMMGGTVALQDQGEGGSCFLVRLPCATHRALGGVPLTEPRSAARAPVAPGHFAQLEQSASEVSAAPDTPRRQAPRLLIAEDNPDMRAYLRELLAAEFEVELQPDGLAALAAAQARRPAVILADVMMPELDGFGLVARLKQDRELCDIPIILLTARASRREVVTGLSVGADDYLAKPFDPEELKARVRAAERLHRAYLDVAQKNRELDQALRQLAEAQEELVQAGKMAAVGTLIAGLSHELNNPLGIILMNAQLILRLAKHRAGAGGSLDEAGLQKPLRLIESQALRCAELVRALLEYVRRKPVTRELCDVRAALERVLMITAPQAVKRRVHLDAQYDAAPLPTVLVSRTQLDSALLNVISNALDAVSEGGSIVVATGAHERDGKPGVQVQVRDTGCGISAEVHRRIGEPFFTTKPPGQGTGLGLSLTKRFFDDHSGALRIESELGVGTTVFMWLPAGSSEAPASQDGER